jgi:hypothetical protein
MKPPAVRDTINPERLGAVVVVERAKRAGVTVTWWRIDDSDRDDELGDVDRTLPNPALPHFRGVAIPARTNQP